MSISSFDALLVMAYWPGVALFASYVVVAILRIRSVRGSLQRTVLRTAERPLRWAAAGFIVVGLLRSIVEVDALGLLTYPVAAFVWTKLWDKIEDDDDDYWRRGWQRFRRALNARRRLVPKVAA